jgi:PAS domain S-box-containing protein
VSDELSQVSTIFPQANALGDRQLLERIAEAAPFMLYVYDLSEHRNIYENRKMADTWGDAQEDIDRGGGPFAGLIHEDDRERVVKGIEERFATLKDGEATETEYRVRCGEGQWRWVRTRCVVFNRTSDGSPRQILGTMQDVTEQKYAEQALEQSRTLLHLVANAAPVVIYMYDLLAGKTTFVNKQRYSVYGHTPETDEYAFFSTIHPDDLPSLLGIRERVATAPNGVPVETEYRARHPSGEWRWYEDRVIVLTRTPEGQPWQVLGTAYDISDRKRAEAITREREILIAKLAESLPLLLYLYDFTESRIVYHNKHLDLMFGGSPDATAMSSPELLRTFVHEDDWPELLMKLPEHVLELNAGRVVEFECRARGEDGRWHWLLCRNQAFTRTAEGAVSQVIGTVEDVTDRKERELALARLELAISSASDAIGIANGSRRFEYINAAAEAIYGYTQEELRDFDSSSLISSAETRAEISRALKTDQRWIGELDIRHKTGQDIPVFLRITNLRDSFGRYIGTVGVATDLSERRNVERDLARHQEDLAHALQVASLAEMAGGIAHELNQPLAAIASYASGCARRIRSGSAQFADLLDAVTEISEEAIRGGEIIRRVKRLVERRELERLPIDVGQLVTKVARMIGRDPRARQVEVALELPRQSVLVNGDLIELEQVLLNLARNALDAMQSHPEACHLSLRVSASSEVIIEVSDRGPGVAEEVTRIFDPFVSSKNGHLGLGLSISASIVKAHGGRIWARNNDGAGATFCVALPILVGTAE